MASVAELQEKVFELLEEKESAADIFAVQKQAFDVLQKVQQQKQQQPVFIASEPQQKAPNYLLYIGIGLVGILLFRKLK